MKKRVAMILTAAALTGGVLTGCGGSHAYPANYQANYLNSCEAETTAQACECSLAYLEAHVPIGKFRAGEAAIEDGSDTPQWVYDAVGACD